MISRRGKSEQSVCNKIRNFFSGDLTDKISHTDTVRIMLKRCYAKVSSLMTYLNMIETRLGL